MSISFTNSSIVPKQTQLIKKLKGIDRGDFEFSFPVLDDTGTIIGAIRVVNENIASDPEVIRQMTRWREANAEKFFTQFSPTCERTSAWLKNVVLPDMSRILFLVEGMGRQRLGQFGLCGINSDEAQLDNGIRGEAGGHPQLFHHVEVAVIHFCFELLGVTRVFGKMFSNNTMAILLHRIVGLSVENTQPLQILSTPGETCYEVATSPDLVNTKIQLTTLSINRTEFYSKYPNLPSSNLACLPE